MRLAALVRMSFYYSLEATSKGLAPLTSSREICTKDGAIDLVGHQGWAFSNSVAVVAASKVGYSLARG